MINLCCLNRLKTLMNLFKKKNLICAQNSRAFTTLNIKYII